MRLFFLFAFIFIAILEDPLFSKSIKNSSSLRDNSIVSSNNINPSISSDPNVNDIIWTEVLPSDGHINNEVKWEEFEQNEEDDFLRNNDYISKPIRNS